MSSQNLSRNTVYKQYVFDRVGQVIQSEFELYTYEQLAVLAGLKPTHNFRRRIREMVSEGLLRATVVFSPRGGLMNVFALPIIEKSEIPF